MRRLVAEDNGTQKGRMPDNHRLDDVSHSEKLTIARSIAEDILNQSPP
jgi:hypothetical protein